MSRYHLPVILLLAACEPADPQLEIAMTMSPVIAMGATEAMVVLFPATDPLTNCEVFRLSEKNAPDPDLLGTYRAKVELSGNKPYQANIWDIVPGRYQVAVFVYDGGKNVLGFGCPPNTALTIEMGKRAEPTAIDIRPPPGG